MVEGEGREVGPDAGAVDGDLFLRAFLSVGGRYAERGLVPECVFRGDSDGTLSGSPLKGEGKGEIRSLTSVTVPFSSRAETENSRVEETPSDSGYSTTQSSATSMTGVGVSSSTGGFSGKGMFSFSFSGSPPHETRLARTAARAISSDMMVLLIVFLSVLSLGPNGPYKKRNGRFPDSPNGARGSVIPRTQI